jgi:hypothetical protein
MLRVFVFSLLAACGPTLPEQGGIDGYARRLHSESFQCDEAQIVLRRTDQRGVVTTIGCGHEATIACRRDYRHWESHCGIRSARQVSSGSP